MPDLFNIGFEVYLISSAIAIGVYFICKWLLRKFIKNETRLKLAAAVIAIVSIPCMALGFVYLFMYYITYTPTRDFDQEVWLSRPSERFQMAEDIIESRMLMQRDTGEVRLLLGDPGGRSESTGTWHYDMGQGGGGFGFMFHSLIVRFQNHKVVGVEHVKIQD